MGNSSNYRVLPMSEFVDRSDSEDELPRKEAHIQRWPPTQRFLFLVILLQTVAFVAITISYSLKSPGLCSTGDQFLVYSPAQQAVEYEVKSFTDSVAKHGKLPTTIYQDPSKEADDAWTELYKGTLFKIPRREALLLPNKTYPIEDEPGYYLAGLDVFHQLHCLNFIRKALYPGKLVNHDLLKEKHVFHCIDSIRQSLMCSADISVNVWQWSDELSHVVGHSSGAHSCRNFEKVRDWARERRIKKWIDMTLYLDDGLPEPQVIH